LGVLPKEGRPPEGRASFGNQHAYIRPIFGVFTTYRKKCVFPSLLRFPESKFPELLSESEGRASLKIISCADDEESSVLRKRRPYLWVL
jgi:hypothetical protein